MKYLLYMGRYNRQQTRHTIGVVVIVCVCGGAWNVSAGLAAAGQLAVAWNNTRFSSVGSRIHSQRGFVL